MSKAFTKENDDRDDDDGPEEASALPRGTKNYMTRNGADAMRAELKKLLDVERPEVVRTVSWAAGNGDRSENGDYIYGKRRLREIDRRVRYLTKRLEAAEVVDPGSQKSDRVLFGATVTISDEEGVEHTYRIVGVDEVNPSRGDISWISPMARALLNTKAGDVVSLRTPKGEQDIEVLKVEYRAES
jgi:transcription elongation factor GreB